MMPTILLHVAATTRSWIPFTLVALLVCAGCREQEPPPLDLSADTTHAAMRSLSEVLRQTEQHDSLLQALARAGLDDKIRHGGPLTIFAPTDRAFRQSDLRLDTLDGSDTLRTVLNLHLARGRYDTLSVDDSLRIASIAGVPLTLREDRAGLRVEGRRIHQSYAAGDGIVHVIHSLLELPAPDTSNGASLSDVRQPNGQP